SPRASHLVHRCAFCASNYSAPTVTHTLSLHDALPIYDARKNASDSDRLHGEFARQVGAPYGMFRTPLLAPSGLPCNAPPWGTVADRKSTRLNSSHQIISYAVFCLKKKTKHAKTMKQKS